MSYELPPPSSLHSCSGVCWTPQVLWGIWPLLPKERALPATGGSRRLKHTEGGVMAEVYDTSEFRNGLKILYAGAPFAFIEFKHAKPGKGSAFVRTRTKSLPAGRGPEAALKSGEKVGRTDMEEKEMQLLY